MKIFTAFVFAIALTSCASKKCIDCKTETLSVDIQARSGSNVSGTLQLQELPNQKGLAITGYVRNLSPGAHGFHVHEHGDCSAEDASSAGAHFGHENEIHAGPLHRRRHAGDLGNIQADSQGIAEINVQATQLCLSGADCSVLGRSLVVHAEPDDYRSQPAGNSGARVGCGEIAKRSCCE